MSDLKKEFVAFETELDVVNIRCDGDRRRRSDINYVKYVEALNKYATQRLGLTGDVYVILKPVYLHQTKIHSLIFNICRDGKRYSARLIRRVSLGLRDREGDRWLGMLKTAMEIAFSLPPVGLDPKLENLPCWLESNKNCLRMEFGINDSTLVINAIKVVKASGKKGELLEILRQLSERGL